MVDNPPAGFPRITPYLLYEDVDATLDWLIAAFGFTEQVRMKGPDGKANHAEVSLGDGVVMMGHPGPDYQNPKRRGGATQLVYVYVDDVDKHFAVAKAAGAHPPRACRPVLRRSHLRGRGPRRPPVVIRPARARRRPGRHASVGMWPRVVSGSRLLG